MQYKGRKFNIAIVYESQGSRKPPQILKWQMLKLHKRRLDFMMLFKMKKKQLKARYIFIKH